jgi:hypothetical protein
MKMELASLIKYAIIRKDKDCKVKRNNLMLFFTPCEELDGASMFCILAPSYKLIKPIVEKINEELIIDINVNIKNINRYTSSKSFEP